MAKKVGLGIILAYESTTPGTFTAVGELYDFSPYEISADTVDVTDHSNTDGIRRKIAALIDCRIPLQEIFRMACPLQITVGQIGVREQ